MVLQRLKSPECIVHRGYVQATDNSEQESSVLLSFSSKTSPLEVYLESPTWDLPEVWENKEATRWCCGAIIIQVHQTRDFFPKRGKL